jgi:putative transcriptional regulator
MKNRIRILRAEFDMTQSQLAEHIGVSRQSIVAIENSKYVPSTILALKMAKLFNTDVSNIFSLEDTD